MPYIFSRATHITTRTTTDDDPSITTCHGMCHVVEVVVRSRRRSRLIAMYAFTKTYNEMVMVSMKYYNEFNTCTGTTKE